MIWYLDENTMLEVCFMWINEEEVTENPEEDSNTETKPQDSITAMGSVITHRGENIIYCLTVIGQIEGHYILPPSNKTTKYEHVIPSLLAIDEDEHIDGLLVLLNTSGGDVEAGLAIAVGLSGAGRRSFDRHPAGGGLRQELYR